MNELPKIVAGLMSIAALSASVFNGVDPMQCVIRGGIAWVVGMVAGTIWNLFFTRTAQVPSAQIVPLQVETTDIENDEAESKEAA